MTSSGILPLRQESLATWTTSLRDSQSEDPFVLIYHKGSTRLIFVGAQHDNDPSGKTFALIRDAFTLWQVDTAIVEGYGAETEVAALLALADEPLDAAGQQPNGETVPAVRGAVGVGAKVLGGEANDLDVRLIAQDSGTDPRDVLGFYVLRVIPQWLRDGTLVSTRDPKLAMQVEKQLLRSARDLGLENNVFSGFVAWADWYRNANGKSVEAGIDVEEVGPLADGRWATNRIATSIAKARDTHLLSIISGQVSERKSVVVVFGGSHALILRPAFDEGFGPPCYVGSDISDAKRRCLT
jgi:hypothetical protein